VLAVQFHPEVDEKSISNLITNCRSHLQGGSRYVQEEAKIRNRPELVESSAKLMFSILDRFECLHSGFTAGSYAGDRRCH
jgi:hypothetical protein